jgi:hypothetical protein
MTFSILYSRVQAFRGNRISLTMPITLNLCVRLCGSVMGNGMEKGSRNGLKHSRIRTNQTRWFQIYSRILLAAPPKFGLKVIWTSRRQSHLKTEVVDLLVENVSPLVSPIFCSMTVLTRKFFIQAC